MKHASRTLLGLALLCAAAIAQAAPNCTLKLDANDQMQFDKNTATVSASCPTITVQLAHTGKLPVAVMGHNVVISKTADMTEVTTAAAKAGAAADYVPKGDVRVIAATKLIGGGGSATTSFPGSKLKPGEDYSFFCAVPGHWTVMKGKLVVTK